MALFEHGVASGDPLPDRVVIWTAVSSPEPIVALEWVMARDEGLTDVVATGTVVAEAEHDRTVHVDVGGLEEDTYYWYGFASGGESSPIARTRTLPADPSSIRFAYTSCAKHAAGFFNVYGRIADHDDISFMLHLGDYIYETSNTPPASQTASPDIGRGFDPVNECITLDDYRTRYRQYHRDADVQHLHLRHPIIPTSDDHELADGAWKGGAQEHHVEEYGPWEDRRQAAFKARYEWLPIRHANPDDPTQVWRTIHLGSLADIFLMETRSRRDEPREGDDVRNDPTRSAVGPEQKAWLWDGLQSSTARWRVLGNPSVMSQTWLPGLPEEAFFALRKTKLMHLERDDIDCDQWDGYSPERKAIIDLLESLGRGTSVVLSADVHIGLVTELNQDARETDEPVCVEFVSGSVTTQNVDDKMGWARHTESVQHEQLLIEVMPHWKWVDLDSHSYVLIDLDRDRVRAEYWAVDEILERVDGESMSAAFEAAHGDPHVKRVD